MDHLLLQSISYLPDFFLSLLGTLLLTGWLFFLTVSVQAPDGTGARSDRPKVFTEDFRQQVIFIDGLPQIKQAGMALLQENTAGIQVLDTSGYEVYSYQKPEQARSVYSHAELLRLIQSGRAGTVQAVCRDYPHKCLLHGNADR